MLSRLTAGEARGLRRSCALVTAYGGYVSLSRLTRAFARDAGDARGSTWGSAAFVIDVERGPEGPTGARVRLESPTYKEVRADDQLWKKLEEFIGFGFRQREQVRLVSPPTPGRWEHD